MRRKKVFLSLSLCLILGISAIFVFELIINKNKYVDYVQDLNYLEITDDILNPDQGFYRTATVKITTTSVDDRSYIISNNFQLYHLRMDISDFSYANNGIGDLELTHTSLMGIDNLLKSFYDAGKNVIVRFSYDSEFSGNLDKEPAGNMILKHIEQLSQVLNKYPLTLTAIEAGMVGPWGEMHSSVMANSLIISRIIDKFLTEVEDIPILVRTPQMIYDYLNITLNDLPSYEIRKNSKAYRLGFFNDGYLASNSDLGTYSDREIEVDWMAKQTKHLPFGGEVTGPESTLHDIQNCLTEMDKLSLSYLNYEWNTKIVQEKWREQIYDESSGSYTLYYGKTAYEFIRNHLGYRFVLRNSNFSYNKNFNKLKVELEIDNVGFGNLNRNKNLQVCIVKDGEVIRTVSVGKYSGGNNIKFQVDMSKLNGEFYIYLAINSKNSDGNHCYPIRFANDLWNDKLDANLIGKIDII